MATVYFSAPISQTEFNRTLTIQSGEDITVSSLMYPAWFPQAFTQELIFTTKPGYSVVLNLNIVIRKGDAMHEHGHACKHTFLKVADVSLSNEGSNFDIYSCETVDLETNTTGSRVYTRSYNSFLNSLKVVLSTVFFGNEHLRLSFYGNLTVVEGKLHRILSDLLTRIGLFFKQSN